MIEMARNLSFCRLMAQAMNKTLTRSVHVSSKCEKTIKFSSSYDRLLPKVNFSSTVPKPKKETITLHFCHSDGTKSSTQAKIGDNLLDVVVENDIDIDGFGACEGTLACSTCHLIFTKEDFSKIPEKPTDEELDMLDLAYGLEDTSRLGCQVIVTKDMEGMEVCVPGGVSDARNP